MKLHEALATGNPFRSKGWDAALPWVHIEKMLDWDTKGFSKQDLLADDWEVKQEPRVIWVNVYENGFLHAHNTTEKASKELTSRGRTIKFVEVIE